MDFDSPYSHIRERSEALLKQEIDYAKHLGVKSIVVDLPDREDVSGFGLALNSYLSQYHNSLKIVLEVYLSGDETAYENTWSKYVQVKKLCAYSENLKPMLELSADLASL